jgi:GNAT superfamily N-acetyltransferase
MTTLRAVATRADLDVWTDVKSRVAPDDPVSAEQIEATTTPERLLLLAEIGRRVVGCGIADRSSIEGRCFVAPRVLPESRRLGVGTELLRALSDHARGLGYERLAAHVDARDGGSIAFARKFAFEEVDRQVAFVRTVAAEPRVEPPEGLVLVTIAERPDVLRAAYESVGRAAYAEMPLAGRVEYTLEDWEREEATWPEGSVVALGGGEVVGYAGMLRHANGPAAGEQGLLAVRSDRRRRGVATSLRRWQLAWAAAAGVHELVDWTQGDNVAMDALNTTLGYRRAAETLRLEGPLP